MNFFYLSDLMNLYDNHDASFNKVKIKPRKTFVDCIFPSQIRFLHSPCLLKGLCCESGQNEARLVDLGVVVLAETGLLLGGPGAQGLLNIAALLLAAHHESDLARWVGGDRRVGVLSHREDFPAVLLQLSN